MNDIQKIMKLINQAKWREEFQARQRAERQSEGVHAFISYSHRDKAVASELVHSLQTTGIGYDIDEKSVESGDHISEKVRALIRNCTDYVLLVSRHSIESRWCILEYGFAAGAEKRIWLFMADPEAQIPPQLSAHLVVRDRASLLEKLCERRFSVEALDRFINTILGEQPEKFQPLHSQKPGYSWQAPSYAEAMRKPDAFDLLEDAKWIDEPVLTCLEVADILKPTCLILYRKAPASGEARHSLEHQGDRVRADPPLRSIYPPYQITHWEASSRFWHEALNRLIERLPKHV
jgi:hypothetical protein